MFRQLIDCYYFYLLTFMFFPESKQYTYTARLFYLSSVSGVFKSTEVMNPSRNHDNVCVPFPFRQADLYRLPQPGNIVCRFFYYEIMIYSIYFLCDVIDNLFCLFVYILFKSYATIFPRSFFHVVFYSIL